MALITNVPEANLWDVICKDFALQKQPYDEDQVSVYTDKEDYDPAKFTPVLYGKLYATVNTDDNPLDGFDPSLGHPACVGLSLLDPPAASPSPMPAPLPDSKKCSPREYLESYIFPVLLPAMEAMLKQGKLEKCFERKRTKFNALDYLTEYLYSNNRNFHDRDGVELLDIPFVQEWLKDHPRPPLPKSLLWSEEEAALIIQSFWRGYKVRVEPEVQDLRQWQREWREENENISQKVSDFWDKQMPEGADESSEKLAGVRSAPTIAVPVEEYLPENVTTEENIDPGNTDSNSSNTVLQTPTVTVDYTDKQDIQDTTEDLSNNETIDKEKILELE